MNWLTRKLNRFVFIKWIHSGIKSIAKICNLFDNLTKYFDCLFVCIMTNGMQINKLNIVLIKWTQEEQTVQQKSLNSCLHEIYKQSVRFLIFFEKSDHFLLLQRINDGSIEIKVNCLYADTLNFEPSQSKVKNKVPTQRVQSVNQVINGLYWKTDFLSNNSTHILSPQRRSERSTTSVFVYRKRQIQKPKKKL